MNVRFIYPFDDQNGQRVKPYPGYHGFGNALDFPVFYDNPIRAVEDGFLYGAIDRHGGKWAILKSKIQDNGKPARTYYFIHCNKVFTNSHEGREVKVGEVIALSGNTGNVRPKPTARDPYAGTHVHAAVQDGKSGKFVRLGDVKLAGVRFLELPTLKQASDAAKPTEDTKDAQEVKTDVPEVLEASQNEIKDNSNLDIKNETNMQNEALTPLPMEYETIIETQQKTLGASLKTTNGFVGSAGAIAISAITLYTQGLETEAGIASAAFLLMYAINMTGTAANWFAKKFSL